MIRQLFIVLCLFAGMYAAYAAAFQDPTQPDTFEGRAPSSQQHTLSAIITNHSRRLAMIDGRMVRVGESVGDSKVLSISDNVVQLYTPTGKINLYIQSEGVRKPVEQPIMIDRQGKGQ